MFSSKVLGMKILRINKTPGIPMDCGMPGEPETFAERTENTRILQSCECSSTTILAIDTIWKQSPIESCAGMRVNIYSVTFLHAVHERQYLRAELRQIF